MADPGVRAQFAWTRRVCAGRGWAFEAWSEADPRLLANVRFLAGYRRPAVIDTGLTAVVLGAAAGQSSAGAIERALSARHPPVLVRLVVLHLLWTGRLRADLTRPLSAETPVWPREGNDDERTVPDADARSRLVYDGNLVEVVEVDGARVVVRNARTAGFATVKLSRLAAGAMPAGSLSAPDEEPSPGVAWNGLTDAQRAAVSEAPRTSGSC